MASFGAIDDFGEKPRGIGPAEELRVSLRNGVALLTLNRPESLNALSFALLDTLRELLDALETDERVRALVLTGAGPAFSAGADIKEFSRSVALGRGVAVRDFVRRGQAVTAQIEGYSKPVIAAVNGLAYGGGCEITEACHLALAVSSARFCKSEIALGMPPTFGGTQRLPRIVGRKHALEWLLTGDVYTAQDALQRGLVNKLIEGDDLVSAAEALAARITRHHPDAVAAILAAVDRGINLSTEAGLKVEEREFAALVGGSALDEGLSRWLSRKSEGSSAL